MAEYKKLFEILSAIKDAKQMDRFLHEILTTRELEDIWRRWQVMEDLYAGKPQREIADRHKMSLCKITRGSKVLQEQGSICKQILEKRREK